MHLVFGVSNSAFCLHGSVVLVLEVVAYFVVNKTQTHTAFVMMMMMMMILMHSILHS